MRFAIARRAEAHQRSFGLYARPVRLASWNVDSIRAREELVVSWVDEHLPDVLCLQETKCTNERFPFRPFAARGYEAHVHGRGGQGGVALLSRLPVDHVSLGIPGAVAPLDDPRSISATIDGVRIHTVYAPNGRKVGTAHHQVKLAWFRLLRAWIEMDDFADQPVILIGDLNIAPLDIDIWEPSRYRKRNLTSPVERQAFRDLEALGLTDVVRESLGDKHAYTWWNRREGFFDTDRGWRLDHALANDLARRLVDNVWIDRDARTNNPDRRPSDHAPLIVELTTK